MTSTRPATRHRPRLDLSLYLVTDTQLCGARGLGATVAEAVAGGVSLVQLRDPEATDGELIAMGRELRDTLDGSGVPLIINDRVDLVAAIGADGAHIGQGDMPLTEARERLGPHHLLGLSAQLPTQVEAATRAGVSVLDYLGVGAVWPTSTKSNAAGTGGVARVREIAAMSPWPCVAIGGITAERVPELHGSGVAGVAVVSAICGQDDVAAAARQLRRAWEGETS